MTRTGTTDTELKPRMKLKVELEETVVIHPAHHAVETDLSTSWSKEAKLVGLVHTGPQVSKTKPFTPEIDLTMETSLVPMKLVTT